MKEQILKLKENLKELAVEIRQEKDRRNTSFRNGDISNGRNANYNALILKQEARHKHIAYCIMRGKEYSQIEPKVREGNEPDMKLVYSYIPKQEGVA